MRQGRALVAPTLHTAGISVNSREVRALEVVDVDALAAPIGEQRLVGPRAGLM